MEIKKFPELIADNFAADFVDTFKENFEDFAVVQTHFESNFFCPSQLKEIKLFVNKKTTQSNSYHLKMGPRLIFSHLCRENCVCSWVMCIKRYKIYPVLQLGQ